MGSWGHGLLGSDMGSWGQTWEAVQEFPLEIHKSLPSNDLRILSLIKVVSLLARTYGNKRRILGQPPRLGKSGGEIRCQGGEIRWGNPVSGWGNPVGKSGVRVGKSGGE